MPALLFQRKIASDYDTFMSYKCSWRILNRIRMAMGNSKTENMFGFIVETDETYVGKKPAKINNINNKKGRGTNKTPVHGIYDRYLNRVSMNIMFPDENNHKITGQQLIANLDKHCKNNTLIISYDFKGYNTLEKNPINVLGILKSIIQKNNIVPVMASIQIISNAHGFFLKGVDCSADTTILMEIIFNII